MVSHVAQLMQSVRPSLSSCPVCPAKGACVFVTPGYEPGYCLHEYRILHAYLARRLRPHPSAGASQFAQATAEARRVLERVRREMPYDPADSRLLPLDGADGQSRLERFAPLR